MLHVTIGKGGKAMKRLFVILLIMFGLTYSIQAQNPNRKQQKEYVGIGLKGGLNFPRMLYMQNNALSQLPQEPWKLTPMGGLFVEIPVGSMLIIAPEVVYVQRGLETTYEHISGMNVHYSMNVSYADFRLPFELRFPIVPAFQPYLTVGAEAGMRLFGQIHIDRTQPAELDQTIDVGDANMSLIHAGVLAGVGIRSRVNLGSFGMVFKLSATYHQGVLDTYSEREKTGDVPAVNVNAYQLTGSRLPRGLEVCLGIAIPLEPKQDDACASFSRNRQWIKHSRRTSFGF